MVDILTSELILSGKKTVLVWLAAWSNAGLKRTMAHINTKNESKGLKNKDDAERLGQYGDL
jgi:hypothetical protein